MPGLNISNLLPPKPEPPSLFGLLQAISAHRTAVRKIADSIVYQHTLYRQGLESTENGKQAVLAYSDLSDSNRQGEAIGKQAKELLKINESARQYTRQLADALPRATEDLLRRGNTIVFKDPANQDATYVVLQADGTHPDYVVERLMPTENAQDVLRDTVRSQSLSQWLEERQLKFCLSFF